MRTKLIAIVIATAFPLGAMAQGAGIGAGAEAGAKGYEGSASGSASGAAGSGSAEAKGSVMGKDSAMGKDKAAAKKPEKGSPEDLSTRGKAAGGAEARGEAKSQQPSN